jgi:hypothetical protein
MTHDEEFDMTDPPPTAEDLAIVASVSADVIAKLDKALLNAASNDWRKMARLVGNAMAEAKPVVPDLSYSYYVYRLRDFVASGVLEFRGDLTIMRFCELRRTADEP